ncbi:ABC transporter substrate-binding protein [Nocardia zapadnayensis]|uniref:ABC transporter substrate-binding protein n=1 Tax=Nocardia rhamnosiphila TaxID=426716 RepID=UPI0022478815|nr:ABC transporter substrate-binding protein [Nocardia zapadnayensis]MCX0272946.1 ABC transporter substrate-binding protein [Nocardia zapadnayensis]
MRTRRLSRLTLCGLLVAGTGLLGACGSPALEDTAGSGEVPAGYPVTVDNCGFQQTFERPPSRVLLLQGASVGEAETFVSLGLEDTIAANTQYYGISDIPGMAEKVDALPKGDLTLNNAADVPAEQALALRPDLVVSTWSGGFDSRFGFASREMLAQAGIRTLVNPVNCAYGKPENVTPAEEQTYRSGSTESSLEFIDLIGEVFGVQDRATDLTDRLRDRIEAVKSAVAGRAPKRMLIAFPDMSVMNANGQPAVFSGTIYDSVVRAAGGEPSFPDGGWDLTGNLSAEQLAAAQVEVLVVGAYRPGEDLDAEAAKLFAAYPQWNASKNKTYVKVSDGIYLGPANADAIEKIAHVAHPDAF